MRYEAIVNELSPLEMLPAETFEANNAVPQGVCNLVLAFANVYNDFRDITSAHFLLKEAGVSKPREVSTRSGHFGGLLTALLRLQAGVFHELLYLIRKQRKFVQHPAFLKLVGELDQEAREAWKTISAVAFNDPRKDPLSAALLYLRNQISFHYDPKVLRAGLAKYAERDGSAPLFASRGGALRRTRFYFADVAAEAALIEKLNEPSVQDFFSYKGPLVNGVNRFLYQVVTRFVEYRGFSFEPYEPIV